MRTLRTLEATQLTLVPQVAAHTEAMFVVLSAVLKRNNQRSQRLLERLGFARAAPAQTTGQSIEPDEMFMLRPLSPPSPALD